jgi:hypothetical protein
VLPCNWTQAFIVKNWHLGSSTAYGIAMRFCRTTHTGPKGVSLLTSSVFVCCHWAVCDVVWPSGTEVWLPAVSGTCDWRRDRPQFF